MSLVNPSAQPSGSESIGGGRLAPSGWPACSTMRSKRTPDGKSSAVSRAAFSRAPGHVGVPLTAQPVMNTTMPAARTTNFDVTAILGGYSAGVEMRGDHRPGRGAALDQVQHGDDVEVRGEQIGHGVELGVAATGHVDVVGDDEAAPIGRRRGIGQPLAAHVVVVEQTVPVGAVDGATSKADAEPRLLGRARHLTVVNL